MKKGIVQKIIEKAQEHKVLSIVVSVLFCISLSIPGSVLGYSGLMRPVDYMYEDSVYQKVQKDDDRIVLIPIQSSDYAFLNGTSLDVYYACKIIEVLNADEANRPAVIGVSDVIRSSDKESENIDFIKDLKSNNVVLSTSLSFDNNIRVGDDSLATESFSATLKNDSSYSIFLKETEFGFNNILFDTDGIVRSYLWSVNSNGQIIDSFAKKIYDVYWENCNLDISKKYSPKTSSDGFSVISFAQKPGGFNTISPFDIINKRFNPDTFKDKIVIIGPTDDTIIPGYITAINKTGTMHNCEIQANAIYDLLNEQSVVKYSVLNQVSILAVVTFFMACLVLRAPFIYSLIYAVVSLVLCVLISSKLWTQGIMIHPLYYFATMIVAMFISILLNVEKLRIKQSNTNEILSNYIDENVKNAVLNRLNPNNQGIQKGLKKNVVVLFADVRNFTAISQDLGAENVVDLLNDFLSVAEDCVHQYGGTVDKFIGDCIMAFWEDSDGKGSVVDNACRAAMDILKKINLKEESYYSRFGNEIAFGIGIDYGEAIIGDIGSDTRRDYTLIGNAVNFASRLESAAPKGTVLIAQSIYSRIKNYADCEIFEEKLLVKGYTKPMPAYVLKSIGEKINWDSDDVYELHQEDVYTFYVFGTRGSFPVTGRRYSEYGGSTTCFVLKTGKHAVVFDCGTGLFDAKAVLADCTKIDIVLSHMHYDHCIGLLSWYSVIPQNADINFYGNFDEWYGDNTLSELLKSPFWPVDFFKNNQDKMHSCTEYENVVELEDDIIIQFYDAPHPDKAKILDVTMNKTRIVIMVDCEKSNGIPLDVLKNCNLLVYDGMYDDSELSDKVGWGHSSWQQAVELAKNAEVQHLLISHHNPEAWDSVLRDREKEAKKIFKNTAFAKSGTKIVFHK